MCPRVVIWLEVVFMSATLHLNSSILVWNFMFYEICSTETFISATDSRFSGVEAFKVYLGSSYEILFGIWYNLLYFYIGL